MQKKYTENVVDYEINFSVWIYIRSILLALVFIVLFLAFLLFPSRSSQADDVEIVLSPPKEPVLPNILFVVDNSERMQGARSQSISSALLDKDGVFRGEIATRFVSAVMYFKSEPSLTEADGDDAKIDILSGFRDNYVENSYAELASLVSSTEAQGGSAIVPALSSSHTWFSRGIDSATPLSVNTYPSPLTGLRQQDVNKWCTPNSIVLLSQGVPDSISGSVPVPYQRESCNTAAPFSGFENQSGLCAEEMSRTGFISDLRPDTKYPGWRGKQNVTSYTVGVDVTETEAALFLKNIAYMGGGEYFPVSSSMAIKAVLKDIVKKVSISVPYDYTPPEITPDYSATAINNGFIYVPIFTPEVGVFWKGNLFKFKTGAVKNQEYKNELDSVFDQDGVEIKGLNLSQPGWQDYWSTDKSGVGGTSSKMVGNAGRQLYTWLYGENKKLVNIPDGETISPNRVIAENSKITSSMMTVITAEERSAVLDWANWKIDKDFKTGTDSDLDTGEIDSITLTKKSIMPQGAYLHTKPVVVSYSGKNDAVLINGADGILHAFNAGDDAPGGGDELWSFIPQQLLKSLAVLMRNSPSTIPNYGLDGQLISYEVTVNGRIRKIVVFGMRRGGRNLYALDISNREEPVMLWQLLGGSDTDYKLLGQTWSRPHFITVELNGAKPRQVLLFGGGYDPNQDSQTRRVDDDIANAVFIVDALTGERLAYFSANVDSNTDTDDDNISVSITDMNNSVIGVLPVDMNGNGITDRIYASDVGGRVFRIDIPDNSFTDTSITAGLFADVNSAGEGLNRFYSAPEVAYFSQGNQQHLALLIGSGFLPRPLDSSTVDRFYMIKDTAVWRAPVDEGGNVDYVSIDEDMLYDASKNLLQDGNVTEISEARSKLKAGKGWYIDVKSGGVNKKVVSTARVFDSVIYFTAYSGKRKNTDNICTASTAQVSSVIYAISLTDGTAVMDLNMDKSLDFDDRSKQIVSLGLPPGPSIIIPQNNGTGSDDNSRSINGGEDVYKQPKRFIQLNWEQVHDQYEPARAK